MISYDQKEKKEERLMNQKFVKLSLFWKFEIKFNEYKGVKQNEKNIK